MYWTEYGQISPYLKNKRKQPAKTEGKFMYRYINKNRPSGYETIEVTEEEWSKLRKSSKDFVFLCV